MRSSSQWTWIVLLFVGIAFASARADDLVDTTPSWDGASNILYFGVPDTSVYGQTVTVPSDGNNVLKSFTFYIQNYGPDLTMQGEVYAWDGLEASGGQLYQSPTVTVTTDGTFHAVTFTPNVALTAGSQYVLFATTDYQDQSVSTSSAWGSVDSDVYPGGLFVFQNNNGDPTQLTSVPWTQDFHGPGADLAFKADFVPEPCTLGLVGVCASLGLLRRRAL